MLSKKFTSNGVKKLFILLTVMFLLSAPLLVSAANPCTIEGLRANNNEFNTLPMCINQIYVWSLGIAALLALLMTILGGYTYMTAAGNAEQAEKGKEYIWGAMIGLALLFSAYLLLRIINPDLVNLRTNSFTCFKNPAAAGCPLAPAPGASPP